MRHNTQSMFTCARVRTDSSKVKCRNFNMPTTDWLCLPPSTTTETFARALLSKLLLRLYQKAPYLARICQPSSSFLKDTL